MSFDTFAQLRAEVDRLQAELATALEFQCPGHVRVCFISGGVQHAGWYAIDDEKGGVLTVDGKWDIDFDDDWDDRHRFETADEAKDAVRRSQR